MSLVVTAAAVAGGLALGRWLTQRAIRNAPAKPVAKIAKSDGDPAPEKSIPWDRFACRLGDVVVRQDGAEAWLAGALVFSEDAPAAVLFVAPEAKVDRAVFVHAKPSAELLWLAPIAEDSWKARSAEPPTSIELDGEPFDRIRRLPFRVERIGEGAPDLGPDVIFAEYKSTRSEEKRVISISGSGHSRAWRGEKIDVAACDVLPSGSRTT
ncbi:MAG: hypothetical protein ACRELY_06385 [Polyangiaceae bacterium]